MGHVVSEIRCLRNMLSPAPSSKSYYVYGVLTSLKSVQTTQR